MTRVVVWVTEGTWAACVDAVAGMAAADITLLHVTDGDVAEAVHGAFGGLLGRGGPDPADRLDTTAAGQLLQTALDRLNRPAATEIRAGRVGHEVAAACADADLLVCARDGAHDRPGPRSLGKHTRFAVDHAPCAVLLIWPS
jgi:nucleotide-binding universal stress UspA family protein